MRSFRKVRCFCGVLQSCDGTLWCPCFRSSCDCVLERGRAVRSDAQMQRVRHPPRVLATNRLRPWEIHWIQWWRQDGSACTSPWSVHQHRRLGCLCARLSVKPQHMYDEMYMCTGLYNWVFSAECPIDTGDGEKSCKVADVKPATNIVWSKASTRTSFPPI